MASLSYEVPISLAPQRFRCRECPWQGTKPSLSDNTPLELKPGEQRPAQSYVALCPCCLGDVDICR